MPLQKRRLNRYRNSAKQNGKHECMEIVSLPTPRTVTMLFHSLRFDFPMEETFLPNPSHISRDGGGGFDELKLIYW